MLEPVPEGVQGEAAPVLDSAKEAPAPSDPGLPAPDAPAEPVAPAPVDDAASRADIAPVEIAPVRTETGETVTRLPDPVRPADEGHVVKTIENRILITIGAITFVESPDIQRLAADRDEVIFETLPRGRTRETIVRPNGVQVVTVRNRFGDIIQRSRILPDGREVILSYAQEYDREDYVEWRDPSFDLPPMRLTIPVREYTLDARYVENDGDYYDFLELPPVERIEKVYSIQDVKRSARVRDKARRVEMGNITFGFGSADIAEDQIPTLEGLAQALSRLIEQNPGETFLIEGHTDAVGLDGANLALSDRRAESVAVALTDVFGIPAENLATQGYGERFLKVKTQSKEPLNRRVVFRRITPLIAPVASAQ